MNLPEGLSKFHEALHLFKENRFDAAAKVLEEVLVKSPNDQDALEALGVIYGKLNRLDEAIDLMNGMLALYPGTPRYRIALGRLYAASGLAALCG